MLGAVTRYCFGNRVKDLKTIKYNTVMIKALEGFHVEYLLDSVKQ